MTLEYLFVVTLGNTLPSVIALALAVVACKGEAAFEQRGSTRRIEPTDAPVGRFS